METRSYMKPSEVDVLIAQKDIRVKARSFEAGDEFTYKKCFPKWRRDWRKVMNLYRRGMVCTPEQWAELQGKPYEPVEQDVVENNVVDEKSQAEQILEPENDAEESEYSREKMEERYRELGGRVAKDWTDEELADRIEKKEQEH